jgi:hypothetical protein
MTRSTYSVAPSSSSATPSDDNAAMQQQQRLERERQIREQAARKRKQLALQVQQAAASEQERIQQALEENKANKAAYVAYLKQQLAVQRREMATVAASGRRESEGGVSVGPLLRVAAHSSQQGGIDAHPSIINQDIHEKKKEGKQTSRPFSQRNDHEGRVEAEADKETIQLRRNPFPRDQSAAVSSSSSSKGKQFHGLNGNNNNNDDDDDNGDDVVVEDEDDWREGDRVDNNIDIGIRKRRSTRQRSENNDDHHRVVVRVREKGERGGETLRSDIENNYNDIDDNDPPPSPPPPPPFSSSSYSPSKHVNSNSLPVNKQSPSPSSSSSWVKTLDHQPSSLFDSLDLSMSLSQSGTLKRRQASRRATLAQAQAGQISAAARAAEEEFELMSRAADSAAADAISAAAARDDAAMRLLKASQRAASAYGSPKSSRINPAMRKQHQQLVNNEEIIRSKSDGLFHESSMPPTFLQQQQRQKQRLDFGENHTYDRPFAPSPIDNTSNSNQAPIPSSSTSSSHQQSVAVASWSDSNSTPHPVVDSKRVASSSSSSTSSSSMSNVGTSGSVPVRSISDRRLAQQQRMHHPFGNYPNQSNGEQNVAAFSSPLITNPSEPYAASSPAAMTTSPSSSSASAKPPLRGPINSNSRYNYGNQRGPESVAGSDVGGGSSSSSVTSSGKFLSYNSAHTRRKISSSDSVSAPQSVTNEMSSSSSTTSAAVVSHPAAWGRGLITPAEADKMAALSRRREYQAKLAAERENKKAHLAAILAEESEKKRKQMEMDVRIAANAAAEETLAIAAKKAAAAAEREQRHFQEQQQQQQQKIMMMQMKHSQQKPAPTYPSFDVHSTVSVIPQSISPPLPPPQSTMTTSTTSTAAAANTNRDLHTLLTLTDEEMRLRESLQRLDVHIATKKAAVASSSSSSSSSHTKVSPTSSNAAAGGVASGSSIVAPPPPQQQQRTSDKSRATLSTLLAATNSQSNAPVRVSAQRQKEQQLAALPERVAKLRMAAMANSQSSSSSSSSYSSSNASNNVVALPSSTSTASASSSSMSLLPSFSPTPAPPPPDSICASPSVASLAEAIARTRSIVQHARVTPQQLRQAKQQQQQQDVDERLLTKNQISEENNDYNIGSGGGGGGYRKVIRSDTDSEKGMKGENIWPVQPVVRFSGSTLLRHQDQLSSQDRHIAAALPTYSNGYDQNRLDDTEARISKFLDEDVDAEDDYVRNSVVPSRNGVPSSSSSSSKINKGYNSLEEANHQTHRRGVSRSSGGSGIRSGGDGEGAKGRFNEAAALYSTRDMEREIDLLDETILVTGPTTSATSKHPQSRYPSNRNR